MANRVHPTPTDADNSSGSMPAACNDWRIGDADSMSARTTPESTSDAGYTTAGDSPTANTSVSLLPWWGSPYRIGQAGRYLKFFDHKPIVLRNSIDVTSNGGLPSLASPKHKTRDVFLRTMVRQRVSPHAPATNSIGAVNGRWYIPANPRRVLRSVRPEYFAWCHRFRIGLALGTTCRSHQIARHGRSSFSRLQT